MSSSYRLYGIASNSRKLLTDSAFQALQDYVNQEPIAGLHHCTAHATIAFQQYVLHATAGHDQLPHLDQLSHQLVTQPLDDRVACRETENVFHHLCCI